jgi:hypothetical protein
MDHRVVHEAVWAPIAAAAFLAGRFFPFEALAFFACPFRAITSIPCPACGGTRSVVAFAHLDMARAFEMNPLVALGCVAGVLYILHSVRVIISRRPWRPVLDRPALRWGALAILASNWTYLIAVGR